MHMMLTEFVSSRSVWICPLGGNKESSFHAPFWSTRVCPHHLLGVTVVATKSFFSGKSDADLYS